MCTLAGYWAEHRWTHRRPGRPTDWRTLLSDGARTDMERAVDLAETASGSPEEVKPWLNWMEAKVKSRLAIPEYWELIERVALELLGRTELSWKQFLSVVQP
jgi:hypothetical protein